LSEIKENRNSQSDGVANAAAVCGGLRCGTPTGSGVGGEPAEAGRRVATDGATIWAYILKLVQYRLYNLTQDNQEAKTNEAVRHFKSGRRGGRLSRQDIGSGLIALDTKECASFHPGINRVRRNGGQQHARPALWAGRGCVFRRWLELRMHSGASMGCGR